MKQFSWLEVVSEKCCPKCLAVMEETVPLERKVKFLKGDLASVRWSCKTCDFVAIGEFNFEGKEPDSDLVDDHIFDRIRQAKQAESSNGSKPKTRTTPDFVPKEFSSDEAALNAVYPDAVSQEDLLHALNSLFPETMECQDKTVNRVLKPEKVLMGDRGAMEGYSVTYALGEAEVFSSTYFSTNGIPCSLQEDAERAVKAFQSLVKGHTMVPVPRQPRQFTGMGVRIKNSGRIQIEENSQGFK